MKSDADLLREAQALDASYAGAESFDAMMFNKWVEERFERFTKRTDFPKLGYVIHQLNELGIASIVHGRSFHAPLLYVERGKLDEAWQILTPIDDVPDDDPRFFAFQHTQSDTDLYGGGD